MREYLGAVISNGMEDLNKTQLILLTLLVSFMTSIATGIITVSLLQEAPQSVTQTINRVVERTIEQVAPATGSTEIKTKEVVVVKEEDLVIDAINKNSKSLVRIRDNALVNGVSPFYAIGILLNKDGIVLSDRRENISNTTTYTATLSDGTSFLMKVTAIDDNAGIVFFTIVKNPKVQIGAEGAIFADKDLQLGQSVIAIEGEEKNVVSTGRVISFNYSDSEQKNISIVETDINPKTFTFGGPLVNLSGEIVGLRSSKQASLSGGESYVSLNLIKSSMSANNIKK